MKETLRKEILATGAVAVGFAMAEEVDSNVMESYHEWIAGGNHAGMEYLSRHELLKSHPRNVLEDAATVISIAYSYAPADWRPDWLPAIAAYAYGNDYHEVLRAKLQPLVESFNSRFGGQWRICIDSAPLAERYWAMKAGIGRKGLNGSVIVDGYGSYIFLVELLTSLRIDSDSPSEAICASCGECRRACPTGTLLSDSTIDCRRCLNYLTIEHHGEWDPEGMAAMQTPAGQHTLFGCDICQRVCPHNRDIPPTPIKEFHPRLGIIPGKPEERQPDYTNTGIITEDNVLNSTYSGIKSDKKITDYSREDILSLTQEEFSKLFKGSPIKRTKLIGLLRNASNLK